MCTLVTKEAPDFTAKAVMPDNSFAELKLSSYRGKYVVLFFYPLDFTFVCPSEIIAFDAALAKFEKKNAQVIGVLGRFALYAPGVEEHAAQAGRHRADPVSAGVRPDKRFPATSACCWTGRRGPARAVPDRQAGHRPARPDQRPAAGPQRGRGPAGARRLAIPRRARRRLPGQLARGRGSDEADRRGRGDLPGETRQVAGPCECIPVATAPGAMANSTLPEAVSRRL